MLDGLPTLGLQIRSLLGPSPSCRAETICDLTIATAKSPESGKADRSDFSRATSNGKDPRIQAESADRNNFVAAVMTGPMGIGGAGPLPQILRQAPSLPFDRGFLRDPLAQYSQSQPLPLQRLQLLAVAWREETSGQSSSGETTIQAFQIHANGFVGPGQSNRITAMTEADPTPAHWKAWWSARRG